VCNVTEIDLNSEQHLSPNCVIFLSFTSRIFCIYVPISTPARRNTLWSICTLS